MLIREVGVQEHFSEQQHMFRDTILQLPFCRVPVELNAFLQQQS